MPNWRLSGGHRKRPRSNALTFEELIDFRVGEGQQATQQVANVLASARIGPRPESSRSSEENYHVLCQNIAGHSNVQPIMPAIASEDGA